MTQKVLVFGDIGIDDTVALIYAHFNDEIEIVGVVADYGNVSRKKALANVHYIRRTFNISEEIKVIGGAEMPMTGEAPEYFPEIHGEYGLGPITPPQVENNEIIENLFDTIDIIDQYQEDLIIVNTGRLTSLASMFILYQNHMRKVKGFYLMGGAFWVPGNVTAVSEANFYGDPVAAHVVLKNAHNLTIIPLNVTSQAIATPQMVDYIAKVGNAKIIKPLLDYYYHFYKKRNPNVQGSPLHDVLTLMALIHDDMLGYQTLPVHIVHTQNGMARGQSIADIRPFAMEETEKKKMHRIAFTLDYKKFYIDFMTIMTGQRFG